MSRRQRRKEQRARDILEAAFAEFSRRGYAATRLEDVAERLSVAKGTIYFYFSGKEQLFRAMVRAVVEPFFREVTALASTFEGPTEELIARQITAVYRRLAKSRKAHRILRLMVAEGPNFPELTEFYYRDVIAAATAMGKETIERGIRRGELRAAPFRNFPQLLFAPVMMAIIWNLLFARYQPLDLDAYMKAHIDLIMNGLRPPPARGASVSREPGPS